MSFILDNKQVDKVLWLTTPLFWVCLLVVLAVMFIPFGGSLQVLFNMWMELPEYSHGFLVPLISLYLIWQKKAELEEVEFKPSWLGVSIIAIGMAGYLLGELSLMYFIIQYSFLIVLYGVLLSFMGWRAFKIILIPLLILVFMIPLPNLIHNNLSSQLQLISSEIGVAVIRLFGISVYLEGNIIDLGEMKLQVVEACSGLRYLFPLMTLGFMMAYFYKVAFWKRVLLFISSVPVTVLMNSFRIGLIGCTVEYWGIAAAEGLLHDFEGWVVFMLSFAVLFLEAWVLAKIGTDKDKPFSQVFGIDIKERESDEGFNKQVRSFPKSIYIAGLLVLISFSTIAMGFSQRIEVIPQRDAFEFFPLKINTWRGVPDILQQHYLDALKLNDYVMVDYKNTQSKKVNFYIAYYESQKKGASIHSPKACIPGGGWRIEDFSERTIENISVNGQPLRVNRALIKLENNSKLVYYWFQQRGRIITHEFWARWYILWDAITLNRTDGALVRLTVDVPSVGGVEAADELLNDFVHDITPLLPDYIPD